METIIMLSSVSIDVDVQHINHYYLFKRNTTVSIVKGQKGSFAAILIYNVVLSRN